MKVLAHISKQNVKAMPAAADGALLTSGLVFDLASAFLLHSGSGLVIRVLRSPDLSWGSPTL
jgi:hypothetical protein